MNYYIDPKIFYLASLSDEFKSFFCFLGIVFIVLSAVGLISHLCEIVDESDSTQQDDTMEKLKLSSSFKKFLILSIISLLLCCTLPSEKTCIKMMFASLATHENVSSVKKDVFEIIDYIDDKMDEKDEE